MKDQISYSADGRVTTFAGDAAMSVFEMAVLATALRLYSETGMRVNRSYTPTRMMRAGHAHLGESARGIAARDYAGMAGALTVRVHHEKARIAAQA